jgi:aminoglycoside 6'-N-acetyltransferase I
VFLAGPHDLGLVLRAHPDVFDTAPDPDLTRSHLAAEHLHLALAVTDGQVIGMCSGVTHHHPDKPTQWWIDELGVAEPWRRRGIGTRLVAACVAEARQRGCTGIWVVADPTELAEAFWQSLGWERTGTRLAMFATALDR